MNKFLLYLLFSVALSSAKAQSQTTEAPVREYYMYLSGVNTRNDVEKIEAAIQKKPGVSYFLANRYPARYFLLKSANTLSSAQFAKWLDPKYKVEYFGEGSPGKERAIMTGKKLKSKQ